ncbi:MAG TPA: hypothetical protein VGN48_17725 [Pedococcus sp.]|nr:hypothetical protein [Pedococcus sp.]
MTAPASGTVLGSRRMPPSRTSSMESTSKYTHGPPTGNSPRLTTTSQPRTRAQTMNSASGMSRISVIVSTVARARPVSSTVVVSRSVSAAAAC